MSNFVNYFNYIKKSVKKKGFIKTLIFIYRQISFDLKYNTDTKLPVDLVNLKIKDDSINFSFRYEGIDNIIFESIIRKLSKAFINKGLFVDLGCGKGKALMIASKYFSEVIGIELSYEISKICKYNIKQYFKKTSKKPNINILTCNARDYKIPVKANVFYFFNPFHETVINSVLDNIEDSLKLEYRDIVIIYAYAKYKNAFSKRNYRVLFSLNSDNKQINFYNDYGVYVYTNKHL
ncbi:MAG: class I SAM-dependent methyltransferase [Spirochaetota bacterium]|nr:class I SAM-dependent methyltransferase [Spirochaetota bacterium]